MPITVLSPSQTPANTTKYRLNSTIVMGAELTEYWIFETNFEIFRYDRVDCRGGGVGVFVNSSLTSYQLNTDCIIPVIDVNNKSSNLTYRLFSYIPATQFISYIRFNSQ